MGSPCNYKGCEKRQVFKGFCTEHIKAEGLYEQYQAHKSLKKANEKFIEKQLEEIEEKQKQAVVMNNDPIPVIRQAEIEECDEIFYLRQLFNEKLDYWANELSSARNIRQRAEYFLNMCNAAEGLGY